MYKHSKKEVLAKVNRLDPSLRQHITANDIDFLRQYKNIDLGLSMLMESLRDRQFQEQSNKVFLSNYVKQSTYNSSYNLY